MDDSSAITRRSFLAAPVFLSGATQLIVSGVFPILPVPLSIRGCLDRDTLAWEVELLNRSGVSGMVWPPLTCRLSPGDRLAGAEIVMASAKLPVILGVHGTALELTRRYGRHAQKIVPRAIMAPLSVDLSDNARHFKAIAAECGLSLMACTAPGVGIEFVLQIRDEIETLRLVEDSGAHTLSRISEYRRAAPELTIFTSGRGRTLPDEFERGARGVMPPARLAKAYARIWNQYRTGHRDQAIARLSQLDALHSESA